MTNNRVRLFRAGQSLHWSVLQCLINSRLHCV